MNKSNFDKSLYNIKSGIIGLVVGDALGVPHEFKPRSVFDGDAVCDMEGYGTYNLPAGTWSDDSSMTLATLDSLSGGLNYFDIMSKFALWLSGEDYTPAGEVFDIGNTTRDAIFSFILDNQGFVEDNELHDNDSFVSYGCDGERDNGNGSLMRILPVAFFIYYFRGKLSISLEEELSIVHNISGLTHAHKRSMMGCGIYVKIAMEILRYRSYSGSLDGDSIKSLILRGIEFAKEYYSDCGEFLEDIENYECLFNLDVLNYTRDDVRGSGYVVDSLIASIWCLLNTDSYREAVLAAVNLGEDTDTTAAIVGGLAGLYYGFDEIPSGWVGEIARLDYIEDLILRFNKAIYE